MHPQAFGHTLHDALCAKLTRASIRCSCVVARYSMQSALARQGLSSLHVCEYVNVGCACSGDHGCQRFACWIQMNGGD